MDLSKQLKQAKLEISRKAAEERKKKKLQKGGAPAGLNITPLTGA